MSKILWTSNEEMVEKKQREQQETQRRELKIKAERILLAKLATDYLTSDKLTEDEKRAFTTLYEPFMTGEQYVAGDTLEFGGKVYEVLQPHTAQSDWSPDTVPALFKLVYQTETSAGVEVIPDFVPPTGGHDAYSMGDKVLFDGVVYESTMDGNVWNPVSYPQGWKVL